MPAAAGGTIERAGPAERKQVMTIGEAAVALGRSRTTIWRWCRAGRLPTIEIDGSTYLRRADLIRDGWLSE